ncbi:thaumatin family protein [Streptomyces sp. NBC_01198]|uniref:thaumatin family protein n=1 Tax=Streptomyces sp. NBC_01198 TaxID=2903769 RepID=UPI002E12C58E|nr:thaumatin family protein [Streptomyces sp. NBC_01198]
MGSRARHRGRRPGALGWTALAVVALCVAGFALTARQSDGGRSTAGVRTPQSTAATSPPAAPAATATPTPSPARDTPTPSATRTAGPTTQSAKSARSPKVTAAPPKLAAKSGTRVFSFVNGLRQTVWLASGEQTATPALSTTGWVLRPGRTLSVRVPDHWNGRFWGRTGCTFDSAGHGHCATGACDSRFQCAGYGAIPATLAEFNLNSWDGMDFYDVSLVDGSNLPMYINLVGGATKDPISAHGCSRAGCTHLVDCPSALRVKGDACESPCGVFDTDQYCCRAQWAPRTECRPDQWPVNYAAAFKKAEPFAYSYVDDDATSTFTSRGEAGYRITFATSP